MAEREHVALLLPGLAGGGAENVFLDLASTWAPDRRVDLVVMRKRGALVGQVPEGVNLMDLGVGQEAFLGALEGTARFAGYLRRERPEAVLSTLYWANLVALWGSWVSGTGVRAVLRHPNMYARFPDEDTDRLFSRSARVFYPRAKRFVAVSQGVGNELVDVFGVPHERVDIIPNPVSVEHARARAKEPVDHVFFEEGTGPVVMGMGSLTRQKGFDVLVDAFERLAEKVDARLLILGEGPQREHLEARISSRSLEEKVALPGFIENPFPWLHHADVFVLSSRWEGMPNVLLEALAVGTPVVSTDCPSGPSEILKGPLSRFLTPPEDEAALAQGIVDAIEDPPDEATIEAAVEPFRIGPIAERYLEALFSD